MKIINPPKLLNQKQINEIFKIFSANNPDPKTELAYLNPYTLLISVVLSAQATDVSVNKATENLFKIADTPEKIIELGEEKLISYIKKIGLYNAKAKNIMALSHMLIEKFNSEVPNNVEELRQLPGVGRKTANVILNCLYNHPTIAVDTHVFRVSNRIGLCKEKNVLNTELAITKNIPMKWRSNAHHWLILHGRYICKARKPECTKCEINKYCLYEEKNGN